MACHFSKVFESYLFFTFKRLTPANVNTSENTLNQAAFSDQSIYDYVHNINKYDVII